jgi:hypothetical protein
LGAIGSPKQVIYWPNSVTRRRWSG